MLKIRGTSEIRSTHLHVVFCPSIQTKNTIVPCIKDLIYSYEFWIGKCEILEVLKGVIEHPSLYDENSAILRRFANEMSVGNLYDFQYLQYLNAFLFFSINILRMPPRNVIKRDYNADS